MVTEVDAVTAVVVTVKVALELPAGTFTLDGTVAALLLLESVTWAPPAGAAALSVTVPLEDCAPPITLGGFNVSDEADGLTGAVSTESVIVCPLLTCTWEMYSPP